MQNIIKGLKEIVEAEKLSGIDDFFSDSAALPLEKMDSLDKLQNKVHRCSRCRLEKTRTNVVFGEGTAKSGLMIIGEAPGEEEDRQGRPFVGRAGQLLTKIIESIKLKRQDVYIANALKCRPPFNRQPQEDELDNCREYLEAQIKFIKPMVILCVGNFAVRTLLSSGQPISKLRGKFTEFLGIPLMPTFHPSYLLRNPSAKKLVWHDVQKVKAFLDKK